MTWVKICGLQTEAEVDAAVAAGADAVGFVLSTSARRVSATTAATLSRGLPAHVAAVAVFDAANDPGLVHVALDTGLRWVQGHQLTPSQVKILASSGRTVIRAMKATGSGGQRPEDVGQAGELVRLLDGDVPGSGTEWAYDKEVLARQPVPAILAGGLNEFNVKEAISHARPWGVDVSSGVESVPGSKDPAAMTRFVAAAKKTSKHNLRDLVSHPEGVHTRHPK